MGLFDFFNSDERKKNQAAIAIDLQAGVVERCPICGTVFDRQHDERLPAADVAAHEAFDRHDPLIAIFNGNREDLLARLRSAREPLPYACNCEDQG